jgi:hypothetical protein
VKLTAVTGVLLGLLMAFIPGLVLIALWAFGAIQIDFVPRSQPQASAAATATASAPAATAATGSAPSTSSTAVRRSVTYEGTLTGTGGVDGYRATLNERFILSIDENADGTVDAEITIIDSDGEQDTSSLTGETTPDGYRLVDEDGFEAYLVVSGDSIYSKLELDETDELGHWTAWARFEGQEVR